MSFKINKFFFAIFLSIGVSQVARCADYTYIPSFSSNAFSNRPDSHYLFYGVINSVLGIVTTVMAYKINQTRKTIENNKVILDEILKKFIGSQAGNKVSTDLADCRVDQLQEVVHFDNSNDFVFTSLDIDNVKKICRDFNQKDNGSEQVYLMHLQCGLLDKKLKSYWPRLFLLQLSGSIKIFAGLTCLIMYAIDYKIYNKEGTA